MSPSIIMVKFLKMVKGETLSQSTGLMRDKIKKIKKKYI